MYFLLPNCPLLTSVSPPPRDAGEYSDTDLGLHVCRLPYSDFFTVFGCLDNLILTVMAYDCFIAIPHSLHFTAIMNAWFCGLLVLGTRIISVMGSLLEFLTILRLSFCTYPLFCDLLEVLKLTCSDTLINNTVVYFTAGLLAVIPFTGILFSYYHIVSFILRISSAGNLLHLWVSPRGGFPVLWHRPGGLPQSCSHTIL